MIETKIYTNGLKVVSSGSFNTFNESPSVISLIKGEEGFDFLIAFKEDSSSNKSSMNLNTRKDEAKNLVIVDMVLTNFGVGFSTGFVAPIQIGRFDNGEAIYLQLNARKLGNNTPRYEVNYTFYLEEKIK